MRKTYKRKTIEERLGLYSKADAFDTKFWQKQSANAKWSALWQMVGEFYKIKGKDAGKLRLQRLIQNTQQI